jgi:hypothetical protein
MVDWLVGLLFLGPYCPDSYFAHYSIQAVALGRKGGPISERQGAGEDFMR